MKPLSILVADDEPGIRVMLTDWLDRDGHRVACAQSGHEASQLMRQQHFDVVIADVLMPDGDGFELITESKKTQPDTRIIAISGGGRYLHGTECLKVATGLGAHAAVLKPFSIAQLLDSIDDVVTD